MPKRPISPLVLDLTRALLPGSADRTDWHANAIPLIEQAREKILSSGGVVNLAERMLADYAQRRRQSDLGRVLGTAKRINALVDRVIVIGDRDVQLGAQALIAACCHPFHNELSRGERGAYPRVYFLDDPLDNDLVQGLLDLVGRERRAALPDERWGLIVADRDKESAEWRAALRHFAAALSSSAGHDPDRLAQLLVVFGDLEGSLDHLATVCNCERFDWPDEINGLDCIFSVASLLPAAIAGIDVVWLLEGAAALAEAFRTAPLGKSLALDVLGVMRHVARQANRQAVFRFWPHGLAATQRWYDQRCIDTPGLAPSGEFIINIVVDHARRDRLAADAGGTLLDQSAATIMAENERQHVRSTPSADLRLQRLDEPSLGQLLQVLMIVVNGM